MPLFFLLPLFLCVITGYICNKCSDEVGYLSGLFAIISLVLSLILAPWEIQVLLLVVVLVTTKKLLQRNEYKLKFEQSGSNYQTVPQVKRAKREVSRQEFPLKNFQKKKNLMGARQYRGANYQVNIVDTETFSEEVTGKYRGIPWVIRRVKGIVNKSKNQIN